MKILSLFLLLLSFSAYAQYDGPAVEACRKYALQESKREGSQAKDVVIERDARLLIERYTRKLGSQFVSSVLTGNGAVLFEGAPSAELSFICLLASDKQPVFFNWLPRLDAPALAQCTRHDSMRSQSRSCLEYVLRVAEADLAMVYALRFQEANARGGEILVAYRKSTEEWRKYREAECARRRSLAPAGIEPDDYLLACTIELTRRRVLDMR
ncbi:MAG TPA: lysozyme inhibitor LprI family protein [Burkholderiales bacterium]